LFLLFEEIFLQVFKFHRNNPLSLMSPIEAMYLLLGDDRMMLISDLCALKIFKGR
jgi:hypothetical protein